MARYFTILMSLVFGTNHTMSKIAANFLLPKTDYKNSLWGKHVTIAGESWKPWFEISVVPGTKTELKYSGIMWDVLMYLSTSMNFTFTVVRPPDGKWGVGDVNGNWNGMLGMVKRKEVDFALGPFGIIYEREQVCDFTYPVIIDYWTAIVPLSQQQDPWPIVKPFDMYVWMSIASMVPLFLFILIAVNKLFSGKSNWGKNTGFVLRSVMIEPTHWYPKDTGFNKILTATWLIAIFILSQSYSGVLVSMLTIPSVSIPINSVEDMVNQDEIGWSVEGGSIMEQIGRSSKEGTLFKKMYDGATLGGTCYDLKEEIKAGKIGSVCERVTIQKLLSDDFSETGVCHFYVAEVDFLATSFAMAFQVIKSILNLSLFVDFNVFFFILSREVHI